MRRSGTTTTEWFAKYGFLAGAVLVGGAVGCQGLVTALGVRLPGWEHRLVFDAELLGASVGSLALAGTLVTGWRSSPDSPTRVRPDTVVYVTSGLLTVLLDLAEASEPDDCSIGLTTTPAAHLAPAVEGISPGTPVFTHFYPPGVAGSTSAVFGVDLGVPPGRTRGRFVSHPRGRLTVTKRDDLHGIVLVAVPPWDRRSVAAFDRRGREHPLRVVDASPPEEPVPGDPPSERPTGL